MVRLSDNVMLNYRAWLSIERWESDIHSISCVVSFKNFWRVSISYTWWINLVILIQSTTNLNQNNPYVNAYIYQPWMSYTNVITRLCHSIRVAKRTKSYCSEIHDEKCWPTFQLKKIYSVNEILLSTIQTI